MSARISDRVHTLKEEIRTVNRLVLSVSLLLAVGPVWAQRPASPGETENANDNPQACHARNLFVRRRDGMLDAMAIQIIRFAIQGVFESIQSQFV